MADGEKPGVVVIGGGVIGCSIAYHLVKKGVNITLLERDRLGSGASTAAAGMLGAQVESGFPGPMVEMCLQSRRMFPELSRKLKEETGMDIGWIDEGLLRLAESPREAEELRGRGDWQGEQGEKAEWWEADRLRNWEPSLSEHVTGGLYLAEDSQVSAPQLLKALVCGASQRGARLLEGADVCRFYVEGGRILGLETTVGSFYPEKVVLAAGAWSQPIAGELGLHLPVVPVKGESLALRPGKPLFQRTLFGKRCYLVPKADGQVIVGATESWEDVSPGVSAAAVRTLLEEAFRLVPELADAQWLRSWSGVRPGTPDGLPYLGRAPGFRNLYIAGGHFRNGILLSPITGEWMADLLTGRPVPDMESFSPERTTVGALN